MRIYNDDDNKLIDEIEITLNQEEAEDFHFRINDSAHNPGYNYDKHIINDFIEGDVIEDENGLKHIVQSIHTAIYTKLNVREFSEFAQKVILSDKI